MHTGHTPNINYEYEVTHPLCEHGMMAHDVHVWGLL